MAIKMDGHIVTKLRLTDGAGNTVEKTLTEEGTIPTPSGTKQITENGTYDVTDKAAAEVNVQPILKQGQKFTANGTYPVPEGFDGYGEVQVEVEGEGVPTYQTKTVTPTKAQQDVTADEGYDALQKVQINPIPDEYVIPTGNTAPITENGTHDVSGKKNAVVNVPTGPAKSASDVTVTGDTVEIPAGLYANPVEKSVQSGTAGTPTASVSAVENHAVTVTPSVENTEGYVSGETKTGTPVQISASDLVSGTLEITENTAGDGIDVTNYAKVKANVPSSDPDLEEATFTQNGTYTPPAGKDGFSSVTVNVQGGGGGASLLSDVFPVYHAVVELTNDYTGAEAGNFPMTDAQTAELRTFLKNHLYGEIRTCQLIVQAQDDVEPAESRFVRGDLYAISSGASAAIGNALTNANFVKYSSINGTKSASKSWNPSNYGVRVTFNNNASTIYHDMRCDGSNVTSIGAGTYDVWCIVIDDTSKISGAGDSAGDEMSANDALNRLTGGSM